MGSSTTSIEIFFVMRRSDKFYCIHWLIYTKIYTINFLDEQVCHDVEQSYDSE